ncbi:hypothetical protein ABFZ84_07030 [Hyphococcus sp. ECK-19]|uniref:Uncharacterized protein n=1 Tax=Hyphococcus lacteus TaxID=3143536 RepID=A0ABV3Z3D9_9PROT
MKRLFATKSTLLAAASVIAASAVVMPAAADDYAPVAPIEVVIDEISASAAPVVDVDVADKVPLSAKKWALVMAAAGALAGLVKLIGARRVADAIASGTVKTAKVAAKAATSTAKAVGRTVSSPLRFLAVLFGLALFALTGIGIFDVEWIGGLLSGAAMTAVGMFGVVKMRNIFQPVRAKAKKPPFSEVKN